MRTLADVQPGQYYRHYRGEYYCVRAVATSAESGKLAIVYSKAIYPDKVWYHHPNEFLSILPDGRERFALCNVTEVLQSVDPKLLEGVYFVTPTELGEKGKR